MQLSTSLRFLGIDIGATSVDVAVTNGQLDVLDRAAEAVDVREGPDVVLQVVLDLVGKVRAGGRAVDLHGAGVGVPGPVSFRDGMPVAPPIMPGWDRSPIRSTLSQHLGCPRSRWSTTATRTSPTAGTRSSTSFGEVGVRFAHEVHPSEIAHDCWTTVAAMEAVGSRPAFGLNGDPRNVVFQLDVYWAEFAGMDPTRLVEQHGTGSSSCTSRTSTRR